MSSDRPRRRGVGLQHLAMLAAAVAVGAGDGVGVEIDDAVTARGAVGHGVEVVIFEEVVHLLEGVLQEGEQ